MRGLRRGCCGNEAVSYKIKIGICCLAEISIRGWITCNLNTDCVHVFRSLDVVCWRDDNIGVVKLGSTGESVVFHVSDFSRAVGLYQVGGRQIITEFLFVSDAGL